MTSIKPSINYKMLFCHCNAMRCLVWSGAPFLAAIDILFSNDSHFHLFNLLRNPRFLSLKRTTFPTWWWWIKKTTLVKVVSMKVFPWETQMMIDPPVSMYLIKLLEKQKILWIFSKYIVVLPVSTLNFLSLSGHPTFTKSLLSETNDLPTLILSVQDSVLFNQLAFPAIKTKVHEGMLQINALSYVKPTINSRTSVGAMKFIFHMKCSFIVKYRSVIL